MLKNIATYHAIQGLDEPLEIIQAMYGVTKKSAQKILDAGFPIFEGKDLVKLVRGWSDGDGEQIVVKVEGKEVKIPVTWSLNETGRKEIAAAWVSARILTSRTSTSFWLSKAPAFYRGFLLYNSQWIPILTTSDH
jgi:hypothetical protein